MQVSGSPETGNTPSFINPDVIDETLNINESDGAALSAEQNADPSLKKALSLAARGKGGYSLIDNLLFHTSMHYSQSVRQLVVPSVGRLGVLRLAHNSIHWASQKNLPTDRVVWHDVA